MRVAKIEAKSLQKVTEFIHACEHMLEREKYSLKSPYEEWESWPDDDPDKIILQKIKNFIMQNEDMDEDEVDGRIVAYEYLRKKYTHSLSLANLTLNVLMENVCDPMKDYLDFAPHFYTNHVAPEQ